jgi:hypothetical protein
LARILLFLLLILTGVSCFNEPDCIITATSAIKIDFKQSKIDKNTLKSIVVDTAVIFTSVRVSGIDTAYFKNIQTSSLTLPINPKEKTVKYTFNIRSASGAILRKDSLYYSFSSESKIIAPTCGAYTYFINLKLTSTNLAENKHKLINNRLLKNTTNVQVFY